MRERIFTFGSENSLVGVLTEPDPKRKLDDPPALVVTNIGINHRVGANRIWVELARRLAREGFPVLRFDLSGLGDSAPRRDHRTELERAELDLREAIEALQRRGIARRFVVCGLCSGVDSAHALALGDPRVCGAVFVDGYSYPTLSSRVRRLLIRAFAPARWRRRVLSRIAPLWRAQAVGEIQEIYVRSYPTLERFRSDIRGLRARGTRLLFVFSGGVESFLGAGQFWEAVGDSYRDQIALRHLPRADHLFTSVIDRAELLDILVDWISLNFAHSPAQSAPDMAVG
jgi:pimeloyl-ACP methyl ester carboxylesterase